MRSLKPGANILEVGCGRGAGANLIFKNFQPSHLHILDLDLKMIQKARTHLSAASKDAVNMYVGDAIDLPFKTGSLDAIFGFGFLHHVPDWRQGLSEIARVLKPITSKNSILPFIKMLSPSEFSSTPNTIAFPATIFEWHWMKRTCVLRMSLSSEKWASWAWPLKSHSEIFS